MKRFIDLPLRFFLVITGFLFIFNLPFFMGIGKESIVFRFGNFWKMVKSDTKLIIQATDMKFTDFLSQLNFLESYGYTMSLFVASLLVVTSLSLLIAILVLLTPNTFSSGLKRIIDFFEAVPDLMVIFFIQFFVITLYKTTGLKFLQLYGVFGAKPYFVPIVTISFLPLFLFTQFFIKIIAEERTKLYALYGTAKGMSSLRILLVHILRNIFPLMILQLRTIIWVILSNIYLVEFMFNLPGFTRFFEKILFLGGDIVSLIICLLFLTIPLIVIETVGWITTKRIGGKEAVSI
jgi:peptide/nickel transport system permease protein